MFSFFKSSKKSPLSPSEPPKSDEHTQRGGDEFVVIGQSPGSIYPSGQLPAPPAPAPVVSPQHVPFNRQYSVQIANYTQNVPFKLNPVLCSNGSDTEIFEFKLREITQMINQVSNFKDYDFKLERSLVDQN